MLNNLLIFVPTYNEKGNIKKIIRMILSLKLESFDMLFVDDNSPDGTGEVLDQLAKKYHNLFVVHRKCKLGIGSAHQAGITWAYRHKYHKLVTLDCDFSHNPRYIPKLLRLSNEYPVVITSRFVNKNSLRGWSLTRKILTKIGHLLTRTLLGMKYDASGAFRVYNLDKIPKEIFNLVKSRGYAFFFESLFVLEFNRFPITELSISLPSRTYGHSKMTYREVWHSVRFLMNLFIKSLFVKKQYLLKFPIKRKTDNSFQEWELYWDSSNKTRIVYNLIASFYRNFLIKPNLEYFIKKHFVNREAILHAGCGGGEVDTKIVRMFNVTALDFSPKALAQYRLINGRGAKTILADIRQLPFAKEVFSGVYNLGVMEHFGYSEVHQILKEFHRVLKTKGKIVLFWPPEFGLSVLFFKVLTKLFRALGIKKVKFHPTEVSRLKSKLEAGVYLKKAGFTLVDYSFGIRDFFTYSVVVGEKK